MDRDTAPSDDTVQDGGLVIEERMNRREGLVEYEGTVGDEGSDAMRAGAATLAGTGTTAMVDDGATMAGGGAASSDVIPSMSTDNTASGGAAMATADSGLLSQVQEGMKVLDAAGDEVGKVDYVKAGDPQAATTMGQQGNAEGVGDGGVLGISSDATAGSNTGTVGSGRAAFAVGDGGTDDAPNVDEPFRSELLRSGFFRVDGKGWFDTDRYITPDQISSVSGDGVTLTRRKDELIKE